MATEIHPTAIIGEGSEIGGDVHIGPYCVVSGAAVIGRGTRLRSHVVIEGRVFIGEDCDLYPFSSVGNPPQDLKYRGEDTLVRIGSNNIIRESVTVHRGSAGGGGETVIGDGNFFMAYTHVAHDCKIGNRVIMANYTALAGHVTVEDSVVMGGILGVQQHCRVGAYAMIGGMSRIVMDVPPYVMVSGPDKPRLFGLNIVGLKRNGFSEERISELKKAYNIFFRDKLSRKEAIKKVQEELPYTDDIRRLVEFMQSSKRVTSR